MALLRLFANILMYLFVISKLLATMRLRACFWNNVGKYRGIVRMYVSGLDLTKFNLISDFTDSDHTCCSIEITQLLEDEL